MDALPVLITAAAVSVLSADTRLGGIIAGILVVSAIVIVFVLLAV